MTFQDAWREWGWIGLLGLWAAREMWPFLRDQFSAERKAKLAQDQAEREHRAELEERTVKAIEAVAAVLPAMDIRLDHQERNSDVILQTLTVQSTTLQTAVNLIGKQMRGDE